MVSKRVIVTIGFLFLAVCMVGFAWTQWPSSSLEPFSGPEPSTTRTPTNSLRMSPSRFPNSAAFSCPTAGPPSTSISQRMRTTQKSGRRPNRPLKNCLTSSRLEAERHQGDYTITQLSEWYELLGTEGIWDQPGVHVTDLDEASNKLYVGVTSHHDAAGVEAFLDRVSIPRKAVTIAVEEPSVPPATDYNNSPAQVGGRHYLRMGIRFPGPPKFGL